MNVKGEVKIIAPQCYTENTTGDFFETWFRKRLVKSVPKGSTIIMDRASFHRKKRLANLARRHGMRLQFLPAYSPDFNPIEKTWANMKRALIDILPNCETILMAIYAYFCLEVF
jgi:transposase